jgi:pimeloyl-ACP methyl ester carboxylesterase
MAACAADARAPSRRAVATPPGSCRRAPITGEACEAVIVDTVERAMDDAGFGAAHIVGNSLGGYLALLLATRGRARSVMALAPAGGWAVADKAVDATFDHFAVIQAQLKAAAPHAEGDRRRAASRDGVDHDHLRADPGRPDRYQILGVASWAVGAADRLRAAAAVGRRCGADQLTGADHLRYRRPVAGVAVECRAVPSRLAPERRLGGTDGVGHCPQLDVPLETPQLILTA